jgi:predicted DNA-binding protein
MPTKMVTKSIQFHPEVWKLLVNFAEQRDISAASFVRDCIEQFIKRELAEDSYEIMNRVWEQRHPNETEEERYQGRKALAESLAKKSVVEFAKFYNSLKPNNDKVTK